MGDVDEPPATLARRAASLARRAGTDFLISRFTLGGRTRAATVRDRARAVEMTSVTRARLPDATHPADHRQEGPVEPVLGAVPVGAPAVLTAAVAAVVTAAPIVAVPGGELGELGGGLGVFAPARG